MRCWRGFAGRLCSFLTRGDSKVSIVFITIPDAILVAALVSSLVCVLLTIITLVNKRHKITTEILPVATLCQVAVSFVLLAVMLRKAMEGHFDFVFWLALAQFTFFQGMVVHSYHSLFSRWRQLDVTNRQG